MGQSILLCLLSCDRRLGMATSHQSECVVDLAFSFHQESNAVPVSLFWSLQFVARDQTSVVISSLHASSTSCPVLSRIVSFLTLSFHVTFSSFLKTGMMEGFQGFLVNFRHGPRFVSAQYNAKMMDHTVGS